MRHREEIRVPGRPELSHAADAVRAGDVVFVAGILPVDPEGGLVGRGDAVEQARFVLDELRRVLRAAGCAPADVVKVSVFLTDVRDRPRINPLREAFFGDARPASTLVEVSGLAVPAAKVEIDAVAVSAHQMPDRKMDQGGLRTCASRPGAAGLRP